MYENSGYNNNPSFVLDVNSRRQHMMLTHAELGRCLQVARKRIRLSQTAVANQLKVTRQVVSAYESGKRAISAPELQLLCNLFRIYPDDLLGFTRPSDHPF